MRENAVIVGLTMALLSSASYALDPLEPPKALVGPHIRSPGIEHVYSQTDTEPTNGEFLGTSWPDRSSQLRANEAYVSLRHGEHKVVDVFGRLGLVAFEDPILLNGDADMAFGLGAATTLRGTERPGWGALAQFSRGESSPPGSLSYSEIGAWFIQIAGGPTYQLRDDLAVYGGLFIDLLWGEFDRDTYEHDVEENDPLGVFAGVDWAIRPNTHVSLEFQFAGSTLAVAAGLRWAFD